MGLTFSAYTLFHYYLIYKDITTIELLSFFSKGKDVWTYPRRRFSTNLYLLFGTPNLFKAMVYPLLDTLPISGFEYQHEVWSRKAFSLKCNYDLLEWNYYNDEHNDT
jgi:hypothetical protein